MIVRVIGFGIKGFSQLTLEAVEELKQAKKILYLGRRDSYFDKIGLESTESLLSLYKNGASDVENYDRIFSKILKDAEIYGDIAMLYPGHPRVGVTVLQWLTKIAGEGRIQLRVLPGISSFDTMMNDLARDPLEKGSIIMDANRLILFNHTLDPALDLYIYHVCSVGTRHTNFKDASKDNQIKYLREHLLHFYPSTWEVILIRSSEKEGRAPDLISGTIGSLESLLNEINFSTSLFIPGMRPRQVNKHFLKTIEPALAL